MLYVSIYILGLQKMAGAAAERRQVRDRAGAAADGVPAAGHDAGARRRPRRRGLRRLREPAELRAQPSAPGGPPRAPAAAPGRRRRLRRLLRRARPVRLQRALPHVLLAVVVAPSP